MNRCQRLHNQPVRSLVKATINADVKDLLLAKSLSYVPKYGWSSLSIIKATEELDLPLTMHAIIEKQGVSLINYHLANASEQLKHSFVSKEHSFLGLTPKQKIRKALVNRLSLTIPVAARWEEALGIMASSPDTIKELTDHLATDIDQILYFSGERLTGFDWYTHRLAYTYVYTTTELYMNTDKQCVKHTDTLSQDTIQFMDRRLDEFSNILTFSESTRQVTDQAIHLASMGLNMIGLNHFTRRHK